VRRSSAWWPLIALTVLAAVLRLVTLGAQSLWYDEAFTPVHVLRTGLGATLHNVAHTENTPPLWYTLEWAVTRVLGEGAMALRLLSALAGIAMVPVAWAIGCALAGRRAAIVTAGLLATCPLFVWYSQEARAYGLFVLLASLAFLCFLRALADPTSRRMGAFALTASLALLTHYFAVFLLAPMIVWLIWSHRVRAWAAVVPPMLVGAALIPLIVAQGGHGTQWIGEWALVSRMEAIPQYYLTGYTGAALGHGVELFVGMVALGGVVYGLWCALTPREERGALIALTVAACGVGIPVALAAGGADYLAPRNLVAAMVPVSALLAVVIAGRRTGRAGMMLAGMLAGGFLALTVDVALSPRLQRGDWKGVAKVLRAAPGGTAIVTVELGAAPLEYYLPPLDNLPRGTTVRVSEVDEIGYAPLRASAGTPPAPGFHLSERRNIHGLWVYRFTSSAPVTISEVRMREHTITLAPHPEVLVPSSSGKNA
jgi:4-amino-4-deoxy-L-arabinose transferase-like glycosyltransferase